MKLIIVNNKLISNGRLYVLKETLINKGYKVEIGELNSIGGIKIICLVIYDEINNSLEELKEYKEIIDIIDVLEK